MPVILLLTDRMQNSPIRTGQAPQPEPKLQTWVGRRMGTGGSEGRGRKKREEGRLIVGWGVQKQSSGD